MTGKLIRLGLIGVLILVIAWLSLIDLERVPSLWWDEGWTMLVARTWVERGFYGRLLDGGLVAPGLNAAFPTTASVALSFKLLGVGVWQARLPGVLYTFGAMGLMYYLARRLYRIAVARTTVFILLLTIFIYPPARYPPELHPILLGRNVLAEMPALFFLLLAYAALLWAFNGPSYRMLPVALIGGIALQAKLQVVPFWTLSLIVPLMIAILRRWRSMAAKLAIGLIGSWLALVFWDQIEGLLLKGHTLPAGPIVGLFQITAIVLVWTARQEALQIVIVHGGPTLLGLVYATQRVFGKLSVDTPIGTIILRMSLWGLSSSWFLWYALMSVGWPRYLFPAAFVGSIFVAAWLCELAVNSLMPQLIRSTAPLSQAMRSKSRIRVLSNLLPIAIIAILSLTTILALIRTYAVTGNNDAQLVAERLNSQVPDDATIETYDSELFFFLSRRYHYPPDQLHVYLIQRSALKESAPIEYDPLIANPDYLVVGPFSRQWQLYDPVIASGAFRLQSSVGQYDIYQRVR